MDFRAKPTVIDIEFFFQITADIDVARAVRAKEQLAADAPVQKPPSPAHKIVLRLQTNRNFFPSFSGRRTL